MKEEFYQAREEILQKEKSKGTEESQSQYQDTDEGNKITKKKRGGKITLFELHIFPLSKSNKQECFEEITASSIQYNLKMNKQSMVRSF